MRKSLTPLEKRLAAYAVSAGVVLAVAPPTDAQVVYTDIEPDVCLSIIGNHSIDLDGDSVNDFLFRHGYSFAPLDSALGCHTYTCWGDIDGSFDNNRFMAYVYDGQRVFAQDLSAGAVISSGQNFENATGSGGYALFSFGYGAWHGGNDAFVGLKFLADRAGAATTHYGWVRVSAPQDVLSICIHEFAYESTADAPIGAGALPVEPSVTCTPVGPPIVIPAGGGSFAFDIEIVNNGASAEDVDVWLDINGPGVDITKGPFSRTVAAGTSRTRTVNQNIPGIAPAGDYTQTCNVGTFPTPDTSSSFDWEKSAVFTPGVVRVTDWSTESDLSAALAGEAPIEVPTEFGLEANYPNPFNPHTTIRFGLPEAAQVRLVVYDVLGRQVRVLLEGTRETGTHEVVFDAGDLPSGTYLYRLETPRGSFVQRMLLAK